MSFFSDSKNVQLRGPILHADCEASDGSYQEQTLDLNKHVGNDNGVLIWQPGGKFYPKSQKVKLDGSIMKCHCEDSEGEWQETELDLNEQIEVIDGKLQCHS